MIPKEIDTEQNIKQRPVVLLCGWRGARGTRVNNLQSLVKCIPTMRSNNWKCEMVKLSYNEMIENDEIMRYIPTKQLRQS